MKLKIKRLMATYIDAVVAFIIPYFPLYILSNMLSNHIVIEIVLGLISIAVCTILMIYKDLLFKNASIGKKIMRLRIYYNGFVPSKKILIDRNIQSLSVFSGYPFMILFNNKSQGDLISGTEVK